MLAQLRQLASLLSQGDWNYGYQKAEAGTLHIDALKQGRVTLTLVGTTGFYYNAMSAKVMRTLLVGGGKKTAAERKNIKHDAEEEYRDSVYRMASGDTFLGFPPSGVKGAMATAALETAGVTKSSVQRLIFCRSSVCVCGASPTSRWTLSAAPT